MKVTRKTPEVLNDPLMIAGVERVTFCLLIVLFFGLLFKVNLWAACGVTITLYFVAQRLTRKDPRILAILWNVWFLLKDTYDPCKREMFDLQIIDETEEI